MRREGRTPCGPDERGTIDRRYTRAGGPCYIEMPGGERRHRQGAPEIVGRRRREAERGPSRHFLLDKARLIV